MCGEVHIPKQRGFTLIEILVGTAVSSLIISVLISFTVYAAKSMAAMTNYVDLEQKSQNALDTMTSEIRATKFLVSYNTKQHNGVTITNAVTFKDADNQDLSNFNWGAYDLVVIDESHNFRGNPKENENEKGDHGFDLRKFTNEIKCLMYTTNSNKRINMEPTNRIQLPAISGFRMRLTRMPLIKV